MTGDDELTPAEAADIQRLIARRRNIETLGHSWYPKAEYSSMHGGRFRNTPSRAGNPNWRKKATP